MATKKELAVAALENGVVIDHIPSSALFKAVKLLGLEKMSNQLTIGNNLESGLLGTKGIIKVADVEFPESVLNRIALIAPSAIVNIIENFEVAHKRQVVLPDTIVGLVKCDNPKCITNHEPMLTRFHLADRREGIISCHYCGHSVNTLAATIL